MATSDAGVLLHHLLDRIPIGVVAVDVTGTILHCNREAAAILDRPDAAMPGRSLIESFPPAARDQLRELVAGAATSGMHCGPELVQRPAADGTAQTIEVTVAALARPEGAPGALVLLQDVTGRIEAERDRARTEEAAGFQARLLDAVEQAVVATDLDGAIIYWNRYAQTLFGWTAAEVLGRDLLKILPAAGMQSQAAEIMDRLRTGESWSGEFLVQRRDGGTLLVHVTDSPVVDEGGRLVAIIGVSTDISERKRAEQERARILARERDARAEAEATHQQLAEVAIARDRALTEARLLNAVTTAASGQDDLQHILTAALGHLDRALHFTGGSIALVEGDELVVRAAAGRFAETAIGQRLPRGRGRSWQVVETAESFLSNDLAASGARSLSGDGDQTIRSYLAVPLIWRGRAFGLLEIDSTQPGAFSHDDLALMEKVAAALSGPIQLAQRYAAEVRAVAEAEAARRRLAFLAEASTALASSLDVQDTLARVARLAAPAIADWCAVHMRDEDGAIRQAAVFHVHPDKVERAAEMDRRYPQDPNAPAGIANVLRTGKPELYPEAPDWLLQASARDEDHLALLHGVGFRSVMVVPLVARGQTLGAITFVSAESGRRYDEADLALADDLARRAAVAVDNARLYQEAQEALQARNEFLSNVSHDLKTPIATIKGMAQLLQRRAQRAGIPEMERFVEGLSSIDAATTRMTNLIRELIDVARLQTGQPLELDRQRVDLVALAHRVAAEHQQHTDRHHIHVEAADGEVAGEWDPLRLERVIGNLLSNAIKYSPEGGPITITVALEQAEGGPPGANAADRWARLSVSDEGMGIPAADLPHIFERFRRAKNVGRRIEGTGIGLAGARQIVEQHDGTITVQSRERQGSTFTVRLPVQTYPPDPVP